ncbi:MAG: hypothetical protein HY682_02800, partial [Chloroflexi bacterium]|nr:hypothetical protein [Chloroflexota bacterium]
GDDRAIVERIRHLQYYTHFLSLRQERDDDPTDVEALKKMYGLVHRLRELYVVDFLTERRSLGEALTRAGVPGEEIRPLENTAPPSTEEADAWMRDAIGRFSNVAAVRAPYIDILGARFEPARRSDLQGSSALVPVRANKFEKQLLTILEPGGTPTVVPVSVGAVNAVAAGILVGPTEPGWFDSHGTAYFFVPEGAESLVLGVKPMLGERPWIALVDPSGLLRTAGHCEARTKGVCEYTVRNALPGVWRLIYDFRGRGTNLYLLGVPPLIWHDPVKLAIPAGQPASVVGQGGWCCADSE